MKIEDHILLGRCFEKKIQVRVVTYGRWTEKEQTNLIFALIMCGIDATPKELAKYIPSRNREQIRKYINSLKKMGDFEKLFEEFNFVLDEKDKSVGKQYWVVRNTMYIMFIQYFK